MTNFKGIIIIVLISTLSLIFISCSNDEADSKDKTKADHVWKQQTDALKSAKDVAEQLQQSLNQQKEKLDESN